METDDNLMLLAKRSGALYKECMQEVKFRLHYAEQLLKRLAKTSSFNNKVLVSEAVALHFRKIIELIALASISANKTEYARIRAEFHRDWNARLIFRDLERINASFYPVPISGLSSPQYPDGLSVIEEHNTGFLTRDGAISLYERCASVLHAENPFSKKNNYDEISASFNDMIPMFKVLLSNFWVHLVPADQAFCVWMYFDQDKDIDVALFKFNEHSA